MFIATAIRNQSKLLRSEMSPPNHCAPTELWNLKNLVSINISSLRDVSTKLCFALGLTLITAPQLVECSSIVAVIQLPDSSESTI